MKPLPKGCVNNLKNYKIRFLKGDIKEYILKKVRLKDVLNGNESFLKKGLKRFYM